MKSTVLTVSLAGLLLAGCHKADLVTCGPVPTATTPTTVPAGAVSNISLSAFFAKYQAPLQRRGFIIGQSQSISTAGGASLAVAGVNFLYASGAVARDSAYLLLREMYRVPDMVLGDIPTTSRDGQLLVSGGEFLMQVQKPSGQRLYVSLNSRNATLPLWQSPVPPQQDTTPQQFWQLPVPGSGWVVDSTLRVGTRASSYQTRLPFDTIRYSNIDQLYHAYQGAAVVSINVAAPASTDTRVLLRPIGYNGLARATATTTSGSATTTWYTRNMPTGANLKAIVLQSINGQLYVGSQAFTVQSGLLVTPTLTPVSEADAVAFIRAL